MAEVATIARPYAEAAFSLADREGTLGVWSGALSRLAALAGDAGLQNLLGDPKVSDQQLAELLTSSAADGAAPAQAGELRNFVAAVVENKRVPALPAVHEIFETLKNEREGTVDTRIETAFPLADGQLAALVADLERRFKRKIQPQVTVDPELIGGVRVTVGDEVIDGTVRGRLAAMAAVLKS